MLLTYQDDITDEELVELLLTGDREKINNIKFIYRKD